jgi:hypothetical protein
MPLQLAIVHLRHDGGREVDVRMNVAEEFHQSPQQRQRIGQALDWLGFENPEPWEIISWESTDESTDRADMRIAALAKRGVGISVSELPNRHVGVFATDHRNLCLGVHHAFYPWEGITSIEDAIDKVLQAAEAYVERRNGAK